MLDREYKKVIVGKNFLSLIFGLKCLSLNHKTLIIDDVRLPFSNLWHLNLGLTEVTLLKSLGEKYDIECLKNLSHYLEDLSTVVHINDKLIEFSDSAYANIKELARKLPDSLGDVFKQYLAQVDPEIFDSDFNEYTKELARTSQEKFETASFDKIFSSQTNLEIRHIFDEFINYINKDSFRAKQLHYILQVMFQTTFSSSYDDLEIRYLFCSLISPRFTVDQHKLQSDLIYEFKRRGGDITCSELKDWGITNHKLDYVLLDSLDGIVKTNETYLFSQLIPALPFFVCANVQEYKSIKVECQIEHEFLDYYANKRIIFSHDERMGSDFPYWELYFTDNGQMVATYSYSQYQGSKSSFYYHRALDDVFDSLLAILPGLDRADFVSRAMLSISHDVWFENKAKNEKQFSSQHPFDNKLVSNTDKTNIENLYYLGPKLSKSLGLYGYSLEVFSARLV